MSKEMDTSQFPSEEDLPKNDDVSEEKEEVQDESSVDETEEVVDNENELEEKINDLSKQKQEFEDKYLRSQAEIQNMHQRFDKEKQQLIKYDGQKLAKEILPALDNIERALQVDISDESGEQLKKGIEIVQQSLSKALADSDITEIKAENEKFDPNMHQAIQTVPADDNHPADTVVQVLQKGYILKDRVLRPSMVIVAN